MAIEVEYYLTSTKQWLRDYADALGHASGNKIELRGNGLVFPPSVAEGRYELHELADGLALWIVDCTYKIEITHIRNAVLGNDHFCLTFNLSEDAFSIYKQSGRVVEGGKDLSNAIVFSSQSQGLRYVMKAGTHMVVAGLVFHYDWAYKIFSQNEIPIRRSRMSAIVKSLPIQFSTNMDLKIRSVIDELFNCKLSYYIKLKYFEGVAIQLFALFLKNIVSEDSDEEKLPSGDAARIMKFKEWLDLAIENNEETPLLEEAIDRCAMSKINFTKLFNYFYGKNYAEYVKHARIKKAIRMIETGHSVSEAGHKIGYANLGHFARVFREETGTTPKKYQQSLQVKKRRVRK